MKSQKEPTAPTVAFAQQSEESVRLDLWLWASRFYKSRKLSAEAIKGGHIWVNGRRSKPARSVYINDVLRIRKFPEEFVVEVLGLSTKRLGAPLAQGLFRETPESASLREQKKLGRQQMNQAIKHPRGKPSHRDRKALLKMKRQQPDMT
ncbi:MAG: S4 domain-containing protein [Pseudomonadota bacterium]